METKKDWPDGLGDLVPRSEIAAAHVDKHDVKISLKKEVEEKRKAKKESDEKSSDEN